jgi:hypothetical protein
MDDPRLDGRHLSVARHDQYDAAVDDLLDTRGPETAFADQRVRPPLRVRPPARRQSPPRGGTYTLLSLTDGRRHSLRVGLNALGRFASNDLVLQPNYVSRRHCVVTVHATGGCEVHDTASRNGTWVNGRRVAQADLLPGDELSLAGCRFLVAWVGPDGELLPAAEAPETMVGGLSSARGTPT